MPQQIQLRRGVAADWTSANPTLAEGECGFETDTGNIKFGDGVTAWTSLAYFVGTAGNSFGTIAVSGQSDVVADTTGDTFTLAAGSNITITTNAGTDTVTIASSGGVSDGDKGDITVSASGATWTIDNGVVTFAKMQTVGTNVFLGNDGTGTAIEAMSAATALTVIGAQPLDGTLTAFAALTIAANSLTIGTGADAFSQTTFAANTFPARASTGNLVAKAITDFGLSLVDDADATAARTTLGLGTLATQNGTFSGTSSGTNTGDQTSIVGITGTIAQFNAACTDANFQPEDATLTAFAALTIAAESLTIGTGADAFTQVTFAANTFPARASTGSLVAKSITDFGLSLVDDASASVARATLGLAEFDVSFFYPTVADGTVTLNAKASFAGTINQIRGLKTSSGTCTVAIQINGTDVTGLSALAVTSTPQDATASAANTFAAGDRITVVISSNASGLNLEASLKYTR